MTRCCTWLVSILIAVLMAASPAPAAPADSVFTSIAEIHRLPPETADDHLPVDLRAVVTYGGPYQNGIGMFVQDETGGIFINHDEFRFSVGDSVHVRGVTGAGDYAPTVEQPRLTRLGRGDLPDPSTDVARILAGQSDSRWVRLTGSIEAVSRQEEPWYLVMDVDGSWVGVHVFGESGSVQKTVRLGTRITVEGVAATIFNRRRQFIAARIAVPEPRFLRVWPESTPERSEPEALAIGEIATYRPDRWWQAPVEVEGTITYIGPGEDLFTSELMVQDSTGAVRVEVGGASRLELGQVVRVTGRLLGYTYTPVLTRSTVEPTDTRRNPRPIEISVSDLESGQYGGMLTRLEGTLIDTTRTSQAYILTLKAGDRTVTAQLARMGEVSPYETLRPGARVAVTGIARLGPEWIEPTDVPDDIYPQTFHLTLRTPEDVQVISQAPWWTRDRLMYGLGVALLFGIGALTWIVSLRWRVDTQTETIRRQRDRQTALKEEAQAAARAKDAFLAQMSHEIRTPLASVIGYADLMENNPELPERERSYLTTIKDASQRLKDTLDSVLQFSQLEAGTVDLNPEKIRIAEELEAQANIFRPKAEEKNLRFHVRENGGEPIVCQVDRGALHRVLSNLISNAVKYTDEGCVTVGAFEDDNTVTVEVCDTGRGMEPDHVDEMLNPFEQASTGHGREFEGVGLGLAITRRLVEEMGGTLELESQPGEGTCARVHLPRARAADQEAETTAQDDSTQTLSSARS